MKLKLVLPVLALVLMCVASLRSFPRLTTEHSEPCRNCHFSPSGGGARTEYGNSTTAFNELCLPQTKKLVANKYKKPRIGDALIVGFDTRYLLLNDSRVFRMQTDGYLTVEPIHDLFYHFRVGSGGVLENYGMLTMRDSKYSIRVGTFTPAFGLHNEDHTAFNRDSTGNGPLVYLDGISLAGELFGGQAMVEAFNPNQRYMFNFHGFHTLSAGSLGVLAGASLRLSEDSSLFPNLKGVFGGLNWDRFTLMGEADLAGKHNDTVVTYANLTTRLEYGAYLVGEYSFFDHDRHAQSGISEFWRFSFELYPLPFVQIRPSYTYYPRESERSRPDEFFLQFHMGY